MNRSHPLEQSVLIAWPNGHYPALLGTPYCIAHRAALEADPRGRKPIASGHARKRAFRGGTTQNFDYITPANSRPFQLIQSDVSIQELSQTQSGTRLQAYGLRSTPSLRKRFRTQALPKLAPARLKRPGPNKSCVLANEVTIARPL
jgi:hypothetical protein